MRTGEALLLIGGAVGLYFYTKGRAAGRLTFYPGNVTGMAFDGPNPIATVELVVQNTSNTSLHINSLAGNVFSNNYLVGNISNFQGVVIPGNSQRSIPVNIRFMLLGIVNDIIEAFQTGNFRHDLVIEGTVNAEGLAVPLQLNYKIGK